MSAIKYAIWAPHVGYRTRLMPGATGSCWSFREKDACERLSHAAASGHAVKKAKGEAQWMEGVEIRKIEIIDEPTFKDLGAL